MKRVLVVDDTKNIRTLLTTCLEIEGYEVVSAKDGRQALNLFISEKFDLAFLDIKMPEISGTEVLRKIREDRIAIPVVIMTAFATIKNAVECTRLGAVAYLQKPFTADKVKSVIKEIEGLLDLHSILNQVEIEISQENYLHAIEMLKNAIAIEPTNAKLYFLFHKAYLGLGDEVNADRFYKTHELFKEQ